MTGTDLLLVEDTLATRHAWRVVRAFAMRIRDGLAAGAATRRSGGSMTLVLPSEDVRVDWNRTSDSVTIVSHGRPGDDPRSRQPEVAWTDCAMGPDDLEDALRRFAATASADPSDPTEHDRALHVFAALALSIARQAGIEAEAVMVRPPGTDLPGEIHAVLPGGSLGPAAGETLVGLMAERVPAAIDARSVDFVSWTLSRRGSAVHDGDADPIETMRTMRSFGTKPSGLFGTCAA